MTLGNIEPIWVVVDAVRFNDVITAPPVVGTKFELTYDVTITDDSDSYEVTHVTPVGNRPEGNILVAEIGWGFKAIKVGDDNQLDIPEHRNAVKCPAPGGDI